MEFPPQIFDGVFLLRRIHVRRKNTDSAMSAKDDAALPAMGAVLRGEVSTATEVFAGRK